MDYLSASSTDVQRMILGQLDRESLHALQCATSSFDALINHPPISRTSFTNARLYILGWNENMRRFKVAPTEHPVHPTHSYSKFEYELKQTENGPEEQVTISPGDIDGEQKVYPWQRCDQTSDPFATTLSNCLRFHSLCKISLTNITFDSSFIRSLTTVLANERPRKLEFKWPTFDRSLDEVDIKRLRDWIESTGAALGAFQSPVFNEILSMEWIAKSSLSEIRIMVARGGVFEATPELIAKIGDCVSFQVDNLTMGTGSCASILKKRLRLRQSGRLLFTLNETKSCDSFLEEFTEDYDIEKTDRHTIRIIDTSSNVVANFYTRTNISGEFFIAFDARE